MKRLLMTILIMFSKGALAASSIEIWTRSPGIYFEQKEVIKKNLKILQLTSANSIEEKLNDIQVKKYRTFRGQFLKKIVDDQLANQVGDEILLHFQNGMIIPIDLQGDQLVKSNPFIAISYKTDSGKWSDNFPEIVRPRYENVKDPRPLQFTGNKMVLTSKWHPQVAKNGEGDFSPWFFINSLVGIEFVNRRAYEKQFEVTETPTFKSGTKVFRERCQYCHGIRHMGATYGWDYVEPLAIYKQKQPENLFFHVTKQKVNSVERGFLMPSQKDLTEKEAKDLWFWMKEQAENKQKPYAP